MTELAAQADIKGALKDFFGYSQFRGSQEAIIRNILEGKNTFVIMPTGAGKSLCYQLPAVVQEGTALVISPLIALMKNQVDQLNAIGIKARFLNSTLNKGELNKVRKDVKSGEAKLLYVAPESLTKKENIELLKNAQISFVAIDEAHCISEWGHDFRPEYRRIKHIVSEIGNLPIIALTATATPKVQQDIQRNLQMEAADIFKSSFNRSNLFYEVRAKKEVNRQLVEFINRFPKKSGIIYCLARKKVEQLAEFLNINGISALPYHAGLDSSIRMNNQDAFLNERVEVIVATIAFGMGIDKPDVRFVIHYDAPKSLEGYYQETGRAGRDGLDSKCLMFYSPSDIEKLDKFNKDKGVKERENARMLLKEMSDYSVSSLCRRRQLLNYFGEAFEEDCGYCDNCFRDRTIEELEEEPLLALKAVKATEERFDQKHLIHVLTGHKDSYTESYGHDQLQVFGKGKNHDFEFWNAMYRHLMIYGLITKDLDNLLNYQLTKKGKAYLKTGGKLKIHQPIDFDKEEVPSDREEEVNQHINQDNMGDELLEQLFELRQQVAERKGLPPYVIFQENSLREMAQVFPQDEEQFLRITGVGRGKVRKFGAPFIKLIKEFVEDNDIEAHNHLVIKSSVNKSRMKIFIIQQIDRQLDLSEIAEAKKNYHGRVADRDGKHCPQRHQTQSGLLYRPGGG